MPGERVGARPLITRRVRLGDLPVPASGGRYTYDIDTAKNVHGVYLYWTVAGTGATRAQIIADVGAIRVRVGGKLIWDLTATEILDLYKYFNDEKGALTVAGILPLRFTPMMLPLSAQTQQFALGMLTDQNATKRNTFTVEVNMLTPGGGLTVTACEVQLETDDWRPSSIGYHMRWLKYGSAWAAASKQVLDKLPVESNCLAAIGYHVHHTVGTLSRLALKVNDYEQISDTPIDFLNHLLHQAGRTPQTNYQHIDFGLGNDPAAFLDVSRLVNQYLELTWGVAPTTYDVLMQMLYRNLN